LTTVIPELQSAVVGADDDSILESAPEANANGQTIPPEGIDTQEVPEGTTGNREARYRVERNEARAERDALSQKIDQLLTRDAERIASKHLAHGADVFTLSGKTVKDFTDPKTGEIDADLVIQAANEVLGTRPGLRASIAAVDPSQGLGAGVPIEPKPSWERLLNP
jgi:hypothetical protein